MILAHAVNDFSIDLSKNKNSLLAHISEIQYFEQNEGEKPYDYLRFSFGKSPIITYDIQRRQVNVVHNSKYTLYISKYVSDDFVLKAEEIKNAVISNNKVINDKATLESLMQYLI